MSRLVSVLDSNIFFLSALSLMDCYIWIRSAGRCFDVVYIFKLFFKKLFYNNSSTLFWCFFAGEVKLIFTKKILIPEFRPISWHLYSRLYNITNVTRLKMVQVSSPRHLEFLKAQTSVLFYLFAIKRPHFMWTIDL